MINTQHLTKIYPVGNNIYPILKDINFVIKPGEQVALMGPSGSGKSTLLNILGLLDLPSSGKYYLNGTDTALLSHDQRALLRNRTIGFIFQSFLLLPRLNILQNVSLPLLYRGINPKMSHTLALEQLIKVDMADYQTRKPNELSGGQQQRAAIARALIGNPRIILADEPTGALDKTNSRAIMDLLTELNQSAGITLLIITHDETVANRCARVIRLEERVSDPVKLKN